MFMKWIAAAFMAAAVLSAPAAGAQETYPSRLVRLVVGFPPGSSADILGRIYAQKLTEHFGQQFIVENRPGAAGNLAAEWTTRTPPDGYTIVIGSTANTISAHALKLQYSFASDLSPIATFADGPVILMVSSGLGVSSVKEFVAYAKARPGKVAFGSSGLWSAPHMAGEQFSLATGADLSFIPYQGVPAAIADLLGGQIPSVFATAPTAAGYTNDSRVKLLAVTSKERSSLIPNLPTMQEEGLAEVDTSIWYGFFAPKGTPLPVRRRLAEAIVKITELPEVKGALTKNGVEPLSITLDALEKHVVTDLQKWKSVTERVKAKLNR